MTNRPSDWLRNIHLSKQTWPYSLPNYRHEPEQGTPLGNSFYKIRLAIASKGKGKSGGARLITYVKVTRNSVYLTTIFDKSDRSTISDKELEQILKLIP